MAFGLTMAMKMTITMTNGIMSTSRVRMAW
jgi:hypothetical protein